MPDGGPVISGEIAATDKSNSVVKTRLRGVDKDGNAHRLVMSPTAFLQAKTMVFCDDREISAMAVVAEDDPLYVERFDIVEQEGSSAFTELDGAALLCRSESYSQLGIGYDRTMRVWFHTHPFSCAANPSATDNSTFADVFGNMPFAVMLIHSKDGSWGATLRVGQGKIGVKTKLSGVEVDWSAVPDMPAFDPQSVIDEVKKQVKTRAYQAVQFYQPTHAVSGKRWDSDYGGNRWWDKATKVDNGPITHAGGVVKGKFDGGYGPSEEYRPNRKTKKRRRTNVSYEDAAKMWETDFADADALEEYLRNAEQHDAGE